MWLTFLRSLFKYYVLSACILFKIISPVLKHLILFFFFFFIGAVAARVQEGREELLNVQGQEGWW